MALETEGSNPSVHPISPAIRNERGAPVPDETPRDHMADESKEAHAAPALDAMTPGGYAYTIVDDTSESVPALAAASATGARRGVHPLALVGAAIVAAVVAGGAVWLLAPGGGSSSPRLEADVASVLNAFSQSQDGTVITRFEGELPPGFPDDVPIYSGARVVSSLQQVRGDDVGYIVIWDTNDARDKVAADLNTKFSADPWQIDGGQDGRDATVHQFSKIDDPDITGLVLVAESKDDETTTILESVEVTSGAKAAKTEPFVPIDGRALPKGFPDSVPPYDGSIITQSAYTKQAGGQSFAVTYLTKDGASAVLEHYRAKLADAKLAVTDGDASTATLEDAEVIDFSDAEKSIQGEIVVGKFARDAGYTQIEIKLLATESPAATP